MLLAAVVSTILCFFVKCAEGQAPVFAWGAATAAYQIEGAFNEDGRGMSVWDDFSHTPGKTANGDTGDVADDSYHLFEDDISLMTELGINSYRFSISWSRIMPDGEGAINQLGIDHYNKAIDSLLAARITPFVTLYHWDTPLALEKRYGGWLNASMETYFSRYAEVCFEQFGDRVRHWMTINEPMTVAINGYLTGEHAPGRCSDRSVCAAGDSAVEPYVTAHNMLNAHAAAVEVYRERYQSDPLNLGAGRISMVINSDYAYPYNATSTADMAAAQRDLEFQAGWFADPLYFGRYPQSMVELVGARLPTFTQEQSRRVQGSTDYYAFNHYSSRYYASTSAVSGESNGWFDDQLALVSNDNSEGEPIGPVAESVWLNVVPRGIQDMLLWLAERYDNPDIFITENGVDVPGENELPIAQALNDTFRVEYFREYIANVEAAKEAGVSVQGYFAWSLLDNFEWSDGYTCRFGLHYVDYNSGSGSGGGLIRYPKKSAKWYKNHINRSSF